MSNEYNRPFYEIVCGLDNYKLGTIIESETGQRYKLIKTDNDYRKFSRIDKGLRFLTYENMNKKFRIVEEQEEIDVQGIEELPKILFLGKSAEDIKVVLNTIIDKQNEILEAVKQLDNKLKEK